MSFRSGHRSGPSKRSGTTPHDSAPPQGPAYTYIETNDQVAAFCGRLAPDGPVAFDTEFVGENSYIPILELIQIADAQGRIGLVDARGPDDWAPLAALLGDRARVKIAHSAKQDVALLQRVLGCPTLPLFDTQIAAAMVGLGAQTSYNNLVRALAGVSLKGAETISDWSKRPLDAGQLIYAAQDVEFLHTMHAALHARLVEQDRLGWFVEEMEQRAGAFLDDDPTPDDERYSQVRDWMKLDGLELAVLRELAAWREGEARARNQARRLVLADEVLIAVSRKMPESRADLDSLRRINAGQLHRHLDAILGGIRRAKQLPRDQWPRKKRAPRPDMPEGLVELFMAIVRATADQESIAVPLLATRDELTTLAINRNTVEELDLPVLTGWRREMIGEKLLALLDGSKHLRIEARDRVVIDEN